MPPPDCAIPNWSRPCSPRVSLRRQRSTAIWKWWASNAEVAGLLKKAGAKVAPSLAVDAKILASYEGAYRADGFPLEIKVFVKDAKLSAQATGQPEFALKAKSDTAFEFAPARIEMEFAAPGTFILRQGGQVINFKKVTPAAGGNNQ
jgi:hypothetical protein